jgi:hypothetical protein
VIYEHGEPWWTDIDSGKLLIHPPECSLSIIPVEPCSSKSGGYGEGSYGFYLQNISFILIEFFNMP